MLSLVSQQDNRTEGSQVRSAGQRRGRELIETSDWPSLLPSNDGARGPYDVEVQKRVELARGDANIDVWADEHASPSNVIAVECKNWKTAVTRHEVHAFRTVVGDSGANTASSSPRPGSSAERSRRLRIRTSGSSRGRSFRRCSRSGGFGSTSPTIAVATDPLREYTESMKSRIFGKADALPEDRRERFKQLRERYSPLALRLGFGQHGETPAEMPPLPLREVVNTSEPGPRLPDAFFDATSLRPLLEASIAASTAAVEALTRSSVSARSRPQADDFSVVCQSRPRTDF